MIKSTRKTKKAAVIAYKYDSEIEAVKAAKRMNKQKGKRVYVVLEDGGEWLVIHINQLLT